MKEKWICPNMDIQIFTPQEFVTACDPEHMYTITPAQMPAGVHHPYMSSTDCGEGSYQGPIDPSGQVITVTEDAMPQVMAMINSSRKWSLGAKEGHGFDRMTGYDYVSIATSSNSFGGHITGDNIDTFHATLCNDTASENALFVFSGDDSIIKNMS